VREERSLGVEDVVGRVVEEVLELARVHPAVSLKQVRKVRGCARVCVRVMSECVQAAQVEGSHVPCLCVRNALPNVGFMQLFRSVRSRV
jgi:hypothetical protein